MVSDTLQWRSCPLTVAPLVFFDLETTGLRPDRGARITEVAVVGREAVRFSWMRGQTNLDDCALALQLPLLLDHLHAGVIVGHNVRFDFRFIAYEAERLGLRGPTVRFIDTLGLARRLLPAAADYRLATLLETLGIVPDGALHTALTDARATQALFWKLVERGHLQTLADAGMKPLTWTY